MSHSLRRLPTLVEQTAAHLREGFQSGRWAGPLPGVVPLANALTVSKDIVRTALKQPGFPWGSGVRTSWFAPGKGLVKLVFEHGDGSVSQVVRLR